MPSTGCVVTQIRVRANDPRFAQANWDEDLSLGKRTGISSCWSWARARRSVAWARAPEGGLTIGELVEGQITTARNVLQISEEELNLRFCTLTSSMRSAGPSWFKWSSLKFWKLQYRLVREKTVLAEIFSRKAPVGEYVCQAHGRSCPSCTVQLFVSIPNPDQNELQAAQSYLEQAAQVNLVGWICRFVKFRRWCCEMSAGFLVFTLLVDRVGLPFIVAAISGGFSQRAGRWREINGCSYGRRPPPQKPPHVKRLRRPNSEAAALAHFG